MNKKFNAALTYALLAVAVTGCNKGVAAANNGSGATANTKAIPTALQTVTSSSADGSMEDAMTVTAMLTKARNQGAPVQVRPGQMEGAIEFPAVFVFGKEGCFAGSFINMPTLSAVCKNPQSVLSQLPQGLRNQVDPKIGGVVLVWAKTKSECRSCDGYRTAGKAFAINKHPAKKYTEYAFKLN